MLGLTWPRGLLSTLIFELLAVVDDQLQTDLSKLGTLSVSGSPNSFTNGAEQRDMPVLVKLEEQSDDEGRQAVHGICTARAQAQR